MLVLIYVIVAAAAQSFHGSASSPTKKTPATCLNALGKGVLGGTFNKLLIITVPSPPPRPRRRRRSSTARTTLSMAHWKRSRRCSRASTNLSNAIRLHARLPRLSIAITVTLLLLSSSVLEDSIAGVGFRSS